MNGSCGGDSSALSTQTGNHCRSCCLTVAWIGRENVSEVTHSHKVFLFTVTFSGCSLKVYHKEISVFVRRVLERRGHVRLCDTLHRIHKVTIRRGEIAVDALLLSANRTCTETLRRQ